MHAHKMWNIYLLLFLLDRCGRLNNASTAQATDATVSDIFLLIGVFCIEDGSKLFKSNTWCHLYSHESSGFSDLLEIAEHKGTQQVAQPFVVKQLFSCFNNEWQSAQRTPRAGN